MSGPQSPSRRGAALLIVLATLVLAVSASAALARLASTAMTQRTVAAWTVTADDLLLAAETPILAWLVAESSTVVLPPDVTTPEVALLHDAWVIDGTRYELHIAAWDQCGLVPHRVARSGSPLRFAVPPEVLRVLDQVKMPRSQPPGLDLVQGQKKTTEGIDVFPEAVKSQPLVFAEAGGEEAGEGAPSEDPEADLPRRESIGAYVATHNPGRINVNTAPIDLVRRALRLAGRGGLEQIVKARSEGRPTTIEGGRAPAGDRRRMSPEIAGSSNAWAFRIEVRVGVPGGGSVGRMWWAVYVRSESSWECVQRLAITD
ncbi:MAG: hypothetical protein ACYS0G_03710 [Planctomycetota bacterium]|jgi:hypothetical protein